MPARRVTRKVANHPRIVVPPPPFTTVDDAIAEIARGRMIIVVDDEDRENEGDLTMAAELCTAEDVAFIRKYASGVVCVPMTGERLEQLDLPQMVARNEARLGTAFTVSVDAREGITTGISATDRAHTIRLLADPRSTAADLVKPGHVFPLKADDQGVLRRPGHTEAALDLARLAGLRPAGVLCEILAADGTMARGPELIRIARKHGFVLITIRDLVRYRYQRERLVKRIAASRLPTKRGTFRVVVYESPLDGAHHVALVKGTPSASRADVVRIHSQCLTGDVFGSMRCDCGEQMEAALERIEEEGVGAFLYLRQEGRGIGLANKLRAYELQDMGLDTVEANVRLGFAPDQRDYGVAAQILRDLGYEKVRLLTNNPRKVEALRDYGIAVEQRESIEILPNAANERYLRTKRERLGHLLKNPLLREAAAAHGNGRRGRGA